MNSKLSLSLLNLQIWPSLAKYSSGMCKCFSSLSGIHYIPAQICHIYDPTLLGSFSFHIQLNPLNQINQHTERGFFCTTALLLQKQPVNWTGYSLPWLNIKRKVCFFKVVDDILGNFMRCAARGEMGVEGGMGREKMRKQDNLEWLLHFPFPSSIASQPCAVARVV